VIAPGSFDAALFGQDILVRTRLLLFELVSRLELLRSREAPIIEL